MADDSLGDVGSTGSTQVSIQAPIEDSSTLPMLTELDELQAIFDPGLQQVVSPCTLGRDPLLEFEERAVAGKGLDVVNNQ